jgi:hypothetical protein
LDEEKDVFRLLWNAFSKIQTRFFIIFLYVKCIFGKWKTSFFHSEYLLCESSLIVYRNIGERHVLFIIPTFQNPSSVGLQFRICIVCVCVWLYHYHI